MPDQIPPAPSEPLTVDVAPIGTTRTEFVPPMPVPVTRKSGRGGTVLLAAAAFVAVAGIAFAGGRLTAPVAAAAGTGQPGGGGFRGPGRSFEPGGNFPGGGGAGRLFGGGGVTLTGQVTAISTDSITLTLASGASITVPLNSSTTYHQATTASASAVKVGSKVSVQPGATSFNPSGSPAPAGSPATGGFSNIQFGPAVDVTVVSN